MRLIQLLIALNFTLHFNLVSATTLVIGGALCEQSYFEPYFEGEEFLYFQPSVHMFKANHAHELLKLIRLVADIQEITIVAYSMGGKIAVELAKRLPKEKIVLLDPVEGAPPTRPISARFPLWLTQDVPEHLAFKTTIFASDKRLIRTNRFKMDYTNAPLNPDYFRTFIKNALFIRVPNTTHSSFLFHPSQFLRWLINPGDQGAGEELRHQVKDAIHGI